MARVAPRRRSNIGVAVAPDKVTAWISHDSGGTQGDEWSQEIAPMDATASEWPELETALRALFAETGGGSLFIALLPPVAQVRAITLPPVDPEDAVRLVSRGAGKYFVSAREPQVVSVQVQNGSKSETTQAVASAVSQRVIEAIREAAVGAGWKVARIVPAQSTWLSAADLVWANSAALVDHGRVVVIDEDRTEVLVKSQGRPNAFRHLRGVGQDGDKLLELISAPGVPQSSGKNGMRPVAIIGNANTRRRLAPLLRERGLHPLEPEGVWSRVLESPALSAAHFAPLTDDLELVTQQTQSNRETAQRRLAVILGVVAALIFIAGAGARYIGLRKEAATIRAQRTEIAAQVSEAMDARNRIERLTAVMSAVDSMRSTAINWSIVLSDIAEGLPVESYLTQLQGRGDSLAVTGMGKDAGDVVRALRTNPSLYNVSQRGTFRSQLEDGEMVNRFDLVARIRRERAGGDQ